MLRNETAGQRLRRLGVRGALLLIIPSILTANAAGRETEMPTSGSLKTQSGAHEERYDEGERYKSKQRLSKRRDDDPENIEPTEKYAAVIHIVSGKNQPGDNGHKLKEPIVIKATDFANLPLANIPIAFRIVDGGGALDDHFSMTDSRGCAETRWTLGNGSDHIMKVSIADQNYFGEPVYVYAQTGINIETRWISGIRFPRLYDKDVVHDNRILETNHYLVFSDKSSDEAKIRFAKVAEETFHEVMRAFHIQESAELGIIETHLHTKPKLFANVSTVFPYDGFAFNTGYVYPAFDSQSYPWGSVQARENYRRDVKHETVHIIQFLVGLDNLPNLWPDVWFSEGIAVFISHNCPPPANMQEFNEWRQFPYNDNPIKVRDWSDYPVQGRRYYNMFGLAVKYLLHEKGQGKTTTDVLDMYRFMHSSGNGFANAFEKYMGMSVQYYEDNYWSLLTEFLSRLSVMRNGRISYLIDLPIRLLSLAQSIRIGFPATSSTLTNPNLGSRLSKLLSLLSPITNSFPGGTLIASIPEVPCGLLIPDGFSPE